MRASAKLMIFLSLSSCTQERQPQEVINSSESSVSTPATIEPAPGRRVEKSVPVVSKRTKMVEPIHAATGSSEPVSGVPRDDADAPDMEKSRRYAADNTGRNKSSRSVNALTPFDQSSKKGDIDITLAIRRGVMGRRDLSLNVKNIKIITRNGVVTLRGPVESHSERDFIAQLASKTAGVGDVDNQLTVIGH